MKAYPHFEEDESLRSGAHLLGCVGDDIVQPYSKVAGNHPPEMQLPRHFWDHFDSKNPPELQTLMGPPGAAAL